MEKPGCMQSSYIMDARAAFDGLMRARAESHASREDPDALARASEEFDLCLGAAATLYSTPRHGRCALVRTVRRALRLLPRHLRSSALVLLSAASAPGRHACAAAWLEGLGRPPTPENMDAALVVHSITADAEPAALDAEDLAPPRCCRFACDVFPLFAAALCSGDPVASAVSACARITEWHRAGRWPREAEPCEHSHA